MRNKDVEFSAQFINKIVPDTLNSSNHNLDNW